MDSTANPASSARSAARHMSVDFPLPPPLMYQTMRRPPAGGKRRIERNEPRAGICAEENCREIFCSITMHTSSHISGYAETENTTQKRHLIFFHASDIITAVFNLARLH